MNVVELLAVIESGSVERWHAVPGVLAQRLDGHQWEVATLIFLLWPGEATLPLIYLALTHDIQESLTGDIPGHARERWPELRVLHERIEREAREDLKLKTPALKPREHMMLRVADALSLLLHMARQPLKNVGLQERIPAILKTVEEGGDEAAALGEHLAFLYMQKRV